MDVIIISSEQDLAGTNIKKSLLDQASWTEVGIFDNHPVYQHTTIDNVVMISITKQTIFHDHLDREISEVLGIVPAQAIFITRHRSKTGEPTLTTHPIGNYGDAQFGGNSHTLVPCAPRLMTHLLRLIKHHAVKARTYHKVCFEVTHHGPSLTIPTLFAEVGSTEDEWQKKEPAAIIASAVADLLSHYHTEKDAPKDTPVLVGVGGGHYAPRFSNIVWQKKVAFGHMIPTYHIKEDTIPKELFEHALAATPNVNGVYIHKKSLKKSQVTSFKTWFEENDITVFSSKDLEDL